MRPSKPLGCVFKIALIAVFGLGIWYGASIWRVRDPEKLFNSLVREQITIVRVGHSRENAPTLGFDKTAYESITEGMTVSQVIGVFGGYRGERMHRVSAPGPVVLETYRWVGGSSFFALAMFKNGRLIHKYYYVLGDLPPKEYQ